MKGKVADNYQAAWEIQETLKDQPHCWIQWKGTKVCMDVHCKCGYHSHIDGDFAYQIKCPACGTVYMTNGHIEIIELVNLDENKITLVGDIDDD